MTPAPENYLCGREARTSMAQKKKYFSHFLFVHYRKLISLLKHFWPTKSHSLRSPFLKAHSPRKKGSVKKKSLL